MAYRQFNQLQDPWWERQPDETPTAYARFCIYRDLSKRERSAGKVAESVGKSVPTVENQASAHRWRDRVAAFDAEQSRLARERISDQAEKYAEAQMTTATELLYAVRKSIRHVIDNGLILDPGDAAKWADVSIRMAKAAQEAPDQVVEITGKDGGPVQVEIPELDGLSHHEQQSRMSDMLSSVARLDEYRRYGETA